MPISRFLSFRRKPSTEQQTCAKELGSALTAAERDRRAEGEVLRLALHEYPEQFTVGELIRELTGPHPVFHEADDVERAIRTLDHVGLLHQQNKLVWPSRAARYYFTLELE